MDVEVQNPVSRNPVARTRGAGALLLLAAVQYAVLEYVAAAAWHTPSYDYAVDFISDLGNPVAGDVFEGRTVDSPLHLVMDAAFITQGTLFIAAAVLLLGAVNTGRLTRVRRLTGRRALVTGSTSGIGRSIATALAREGATVVVSGRNKDAGDKVVDGIRSAGGEAHFVRADLAEGARAATQLAQAATEAAGGPIDLLVNNAALLIPAQSLTEVDEQLADLALAVNIKAPALLTAALAPAMVGAGGGAVVNIGSINGAVGMSVAALYGATKAALHSLTASWAAELAPQGVRVNAVAPGPTMTEENAAFHDALRGYTAGTPNGRPGTADEVADAVVFLAGGQAAHIHGVTLPVDGGYLAAR